MGESNIVIFSPKGEDLPLAASIARYVKAYITNGYKINDYVLISIFLYFW